MNETKKNSRFVKTIKLLVMDIDGTLTDGKIYMSDQGELFQVLDIVDGCENRCRELGIVHCYQGCRDKGAKLREVADKFGLIPEFNGVYQEIACIGDDINDLPCMQLCGVVCCPADSVDAVKNVADFISCNTGGNGAVREFIEWIMQKGQSNDGCGC